MELLNYSTIFIILLVILKTSADKSKGFCKGANFPTTFYSCYNFKSFPSKHDFIEHDKVKGFSMDGDSNKLGELKTNDLYQADVPDLEILYLQHSQIENIELGAFNFGFNLRKLDLSSNKLQNIDLNVFRDLSMLNELSLEDNPIKDSLQGQSFPSLNLTKLSLSECQLSSIEPSLFKNLNNLRILNLDLNDLTTLSSNIFLPVKNLEELSLMLTKLTLLDPAVFSGLLNLQSLFLSGNPLKTFKENQFLNLNLITLHLEDCELISVQPSLFKNLKNIQYLYLNNNKLTSLDGKVFNSLKNLKEIFLENNPWHCDCQIVFLLETFNKIEINKEYGYPTCATSSSSEFVGKDWFVINKTLLKCTPEVNITTNKEFNQNIAFYKRPYRQKEIFQAKLENQCQILPSSTREKIESVKTDSCVILFPTETCESREGYSLKVEQYQGQVLLSFSNVSQSFQSCEGYEAQHKKDEGKVKLTEPNEVAQVEKASCKNIQKAYNSTLDVESELCVTLYDTINCSGTNFTLMPHSGVKLDKNFNRMVQSFNSCSEFRKKKQLPPVENLFTLNFLQIFENLNYTGRLLEAPIKETCTTLRENMWRKTKSAKTEGCVILFSEQYCLGFQTRLYPGQELKHEFKNKLVSFMACGDANEEVEADFIEFYDNPHFDYFLHKTKLNGTCQQLPLQARNRAESVKSGSCVILFASDSCANYSKNPHLAGFTLQVFPNEGNILPLFENVAQSFQSCESFKSQEKAKPTVTFYGGSEEIELTEEHFLTKNCKNLRNNLRKNITGVETNHCLLLYSEMECLGKNFTLRPNSGVRLDKYFNRLAQSFNSCSEFIQKTQFLTEDLSSLPILQLFEHSNQTGMILSLPIKEVCTTPKESSWNKAASIKTETCVQLYSLAWCQGFSTVLYPRQELDSAFINKTVSFMACENQEDVFTTFEQQEIDAEEEEEAKIVVNYWDKLAEGFGRFIESTFS